MKRILLRYLNGPILILLTLLGIAIQTSVFNFYPLLYLQPDIVLLVVIWIGLKRKFFEGGLLTLILGRVAETHSGTPQGTFMLSYMVIYLFVNAVDRYLVVPRLSSAVLLSIVCSVLFKITHLITLSSLDLASEQWRHTVVFLLPGAVMEGVLGIWILHALDRFDWMTFKDPRASQTLEDELRLSEEWI